jgi:hypothetical protein
VASTLFGREQRTELSQLERTLGIRMERMSSDGARSKHKESARSDRERIPATSRRTLVRLPGELLQAQMEN